MPLRGYQRDNQLWHANPLVGLKMVSPQIGKHWRLKGWRQEGVSAERSLLAFVIYFCGDRYKNYDRVDDKSAEIFSQWLALVHSMNQRF